MKQSNQQNNQSICLRIKIIMNCHIEQIII